MTENEFDKIFDESICEVFGDNEKAGTQRFKAKLSKYISEDGSTTLNENLICFAYIEAFLDSLDVVKRFLKRALTDWARCLASKSMSYSCRPCSCDTRTAISFASPLIVTSTHILLSAAL